MKSPTLVGETTVTAKNQISLPAHALRLVGWQKGDRLLVQTIGKETIVLMRRPENWTETFAGRLGHVFGAHDEALRYLEQERQSWGAE